MRARRRGQKSAAQGNVSPIPKSARLLAPSSEDYFGLHGLAHVEDYAGDEESETEKVDSEAEDYLLRTSLSVMTARRLTLKAIRT